MELSVHVTANESRSVRNTVSTNTYVQQLLQSYSKGEVDSAVVPAVCRAGNGRGRCGGPASVSDSSFSLRLSRSREGAVVRSKVFRELESGLTVPIDVTFVAERL